jgi:hypothetical protein
MTTASMIDTLRRIDEVFIQIAAAAAPALPTDDVVEELWTALERGKIRLVADGKQLGVAPFEGSRVERLRLERAHRPIVEARQRVLGGEA